MSLTKYKQPLKELNISHRQVAEFIGHTREAVTVWLNGRGTPPKVCETHISTEIELLIKSKAVKVA